MGIEAGFYLFPIYENAHLVLDIMDTCIILGNQCLYRGEDGWSLEQKIESGCARLFAAMQG